VIDIEQSKYKYLNETLTQQSKEQKISIEATYGILLLFGALSTFSFVSFIFEGYFEDLSLHLSIARFFQKKINCVIKIFKTTWRIWVVSLKHSIKKTLLSRNENGIQNAILN